MAGEIAATENQKRRLTEHLISVVQTGVRGQDSPYVVDASPSRVLFAGVLQPYRETLAASLTNRTSIGNDFRLRPNGPTPIRLTIKLRWSQYYATFPGWGDVVAANGDQLLTESEDVSENSGLLAEPSSDVGDGEQSADGERVVASQTTDGSTRSSQIILPRAFRRIDVDPDVIRAILEVGSRDVSIGDTELNAAMSSAEQAIRADPMAWRHLDAPSKNERSIGRAGDITSEDDYLAALKSIKNPRVRLPSWSANLSVDCLPDSLDSQLVRCTVLLSNLTPSREDEADPKDDTKRILLEPDVNLQERSLFDARVEISVENADLVPFEFLLAPADYRARPTMAAKGINCVAVQVDSMANVLQTESLPVFKQPLYKTRDDLQVRFDQLTADPLPELQRIEAEMASYIQRWDQFLSSERADRFSPEERSACEQDRNRFATELDRYTLGMAALRTDPRLGRAFILMNTAFDRLGRASGGRITAWRLFQIAFIVSQLPALAVREIEPTDASGHASALRAAASEVGILWFPTGGGKTEAYLGLIATAVLYDRLRGKPRGVCAWMRFPLRMLSLQQLERLGRVIGVLNTLRASTEDIAAGDPFSIGYYVGDSVTPNSISKEDMDRFETDQSYRNEKKLIRKCFFCTAPVELKTDRNLWRLKHVCTNDRCFSNTSTSLGELRGSLPVFIVDNEIYRYLPSVLVGTVDKLAIIGRNRNVAHIVTGVTERCPVHGYCSYNECIEKWSGCTIRPAKLTRLARVKDPGISLLIQDEFHLLRAELGVFNGHYEGLLQYLGRAAFMPPKVLAATATIESYDTHAFHIYLSKARRFPQPSWEEGESFYATSLPRNDRRYYVGLKCHTRSVEDPALRVTSLYHAEIRYLKANPQKAAQILGEPLLPPESVAAALRLYDLSLVYVNKKATGGSIYDKLARTEQQFTRQGLGTITAKLLTGDQGIDEVGSTIDRIEAEKDPREERLDIVIATSLISHGVDLERINMMCMAGVPSHYAEYVQSTSRAARSHPGIVFVCFMARDARELSQYEFFPAMHENMVRLIEAVAVNRFASFAPRKTVPGLLAGVLLCELSPRLFAEKRIKKPLEHVPTLRAALGITPMPGVEAGCVSADALTTAVKEIIGVNGNPLVSNSQRTIVEPEVVEVTQDCLDDVGRTLDLQLKDVLNPITSFRDVDEGLEFGSVSSSTLVPRLRAR